MHRAKGANQVPLTKTDTSIFGSIDCLSDTDVEIGTILDMCQARLNEWFNENQMGEQKKNAEMQEEDHKKNCY